MEYEFLQIVPAPDGGQAAFAEYTRKRRPRIKFMRVPLFGLIQNEDGEQFVVPIVCDGPNGMIPATDLDGYLGWAMPDDENISPATWKERALELLFDDEEDEEEEVVDDEEEDEEEVDEDEAEDEEAGGDDEEDEDDEEEDEFEPGLDGDDSADDEDDDKPRGQIRGRGKRG